MATKYVVLSEFSADGADEIGCYRVEQVVEANNAEQAERRVADHMSDDDLAGGVTLRAVPQRIWDGSRNTFKAETRRRLLRS